ncbi:hypothetical protein TKK_0004921 [Trichogramma kaykai]|uniref:Major facilitator superfamily (MFS) profile domain-containing protein n=1 Tax=Trichogramma kaykai TaxID=54128 RepID=A0ABD2XI02_9HYME
MEAQGMLSGEPARQRKGKKLWQYLAAASACLLSIGVGTGLAWSAPMEKYLESEESHVARMTEEEFSWTSSLLAIGAMVGALPTGALANRLGRKRVLLGLALPFLLSWGLILVANAAWMLNAARLIVGAAIGSACVLVPTYLSEIAEDEVRGTLGALFQFFLTVGIVYGFCLGAYLDYYGLAVGCAVVEILFVATFVAMPESPAWLVSRGQKSEAMKALQRLRGDRYDVRAELSQLQKEAEEKGNRRSSVFDLVRLSVPRKALVICLFGMIFQQLSGINAVIFYAEGIFKAAGSKIDPKLSMILVSSVQCGMALVAAGIVEKAGRKLMLIFSAAVMSCSLTAIGVYFKLKDEEIDVSTLGWLPLASLVIFMIAFSLGMGPIPWMLTGEMFDVEMKGNASSLAVMLNWFLVFLVTKTFPAMAEALGKGGAFWFFAAVMAFAAIYSHVCLVETKGKSIQEVQDALAGKKPSPIVEKF